MDIKIEIPLKKSVFCQDGKVGESIELVIDPDDRQVTHVVVKEDSGAREERLVPVELISGIYADKMILNCKTDELKKLNIFCERDVIMESVDSAISDHRSSMYNFPVTKRVVVENKSVPDGKLTFDGDTYIEATDGRVGRLVKFLVAAESKCITHMVMQSTAFLGPRETFVPITSIERFKDQKIYLNLTKKQVKELQTAPEYA